MSTRCQIKIWVKESDKYEMKHSLYHHCDGYPYWPLNDEGKISGTGGMLEDIRSVLCQLTTTNGLKENVDKYFNDIDCQYEPEDLNFMHGDLEWVYHLYLDFKDVNGLERLDSAILRYSKLRWDEQYDYKIMSPKEDEMTLGWIIEFTDEVE